MVYFIKFWYGYLVVTLSGTSPERFLNLCRNLDIVLWSLRPVDGGYSFCVSRRSFSRMEPLYRKTGTKMKVEKEVGIPFLVRRYRKHFCFPIGIVCAGILLFVMSQFIWKVEISGNSYYSTQVLLDGLQEEGAGYASLKKTIDCKELQTALRKKYEDITWVSAKIEGTRLYIELEERLKAGADDAGQSQNADSPQDLVASSDGTVESIVTRAGTPMVEAGAAVKTGDVLVSGAVEVQDDNGETASVNYVCADADVVLHTTLAYEDSFQAVEEQKILTGERKIRWTAETGGRYFDFFPLGEAENAVVVKTVIPVVLGNDFYFPVTFIRQEALFYEVESRVLSESEISARVEANLEKYCKNFAENGIQIVANSVMIERNGKTVLVTGNLEAYATQTEYAPTTQISLDGTAKESSLLEDSASGGR